MKWKWLFKGMLLGIAASMCPGQTISFTNVPAGYENGSIDLGMGFTGALAVDPSNPDFVYASVGSWQQNQVVKIDFSDQSVRTVASGLFGSVGGLAVPGPNQLVIVDNDDYAPNTIPGETILLCTDKNLDGDFDEAGEIEELIAPILVGSSSFTGGQARIAPAGNPSGIPAGSLLFQDADGGCKGDLFVVTNPRSPATAAFRPSGDAYFSGFDYNGGFDFDSQGRTFMGTTNFSFSGEVLALVNLDHDERIDPDEWNDVITSASLYGGISDLAIDAEDHGFVVTNPWDGYQVQSFEIPSDPLHEACALSDFADTNSPWLTSILLNSRDLPFEPGARNGATMIVGGYAPGWASAANLLTLKPKPVAAVKIWDVYE
jgi:hypothetical protein